MMPRIGLTSLWSDLLDTVSAARARWRLDDARTWPLPGDRWQAPDGREIIVNRLDKHPVEVGTAVHYTVNGCQEPGHGGRMWAAIAKWPVVTRGMHLIERPGRSP